MPTKARRLLSVDRNRRDPAQDILAQGYGFKVVRVDARANTAQVVEDKSRGDRPNENFVRDTVGEARPSVDPNATVSIWCFRADPYTALARVHGSPE